MAGFQLETPQRWRPNDGAQTVAPKRRRPNVGAQMCPTLVLNPQQNFSLPSAEKPDIRLFTSTTEKGLDFFIRFAPLPLAFGLLL